MTIQYQNQTSIGRQLSYQLQKLIYRRKTLLADGLPYAMQFRFRTPDDVGRHMYKYRTYEPETLEWLRQQPCSVSAGLVFDIGANLGWYSVLADRLSGGTAEVFAFEPDPENRRLLIENIKLNQVSGVEAVELAVSDHMGTSELFRYRDINLGRHSLREQKGSQDSIQVQTTTLDEFCRQRGLQDRLIEWVKVDAEGLEPEIIHGARISLDRVKTLILEYSPMYYQPAQAAKMLETLLQAGLTPMLYSERGWVEVDTAEIHEQEIQRDTIWVANR